MIFNSNNRAGTIRTRRSHHCFHIRRNFKFRPSFNRSKRIRREVVRGPHNITRNIVRFVPVDSNPNRNSKVGRNSTYALAFRLGRPVLISVTRTKHPFNINNRQTHHLNRHVTSAVVTIRHQDSVKCSPTELFRRSKFNIASIARLTSSSSGQVISLVGTTRRQAYTPTSVMPSNPIPSDKIRRAQVSRPTLIRPTVRPGTIF